MTIPRLPGLFEEIQPGLQSLGSGLQQLFRPDLPAQQALRQQLIQDPSTVSAIQNMNPQEREAYINALGLKNNQFRNQISSMPMSQDRQLKDQKYAAIQKLPEDERNSLLTGTDSPQDKAYKAIQIQSGTQNLERGKLGIEKDKQDLTKGEFELKAATQDYERKLRRDKLIRDFRGDTNKLYKSYRSGSLGVEDTMALLSDKTLGDFFNDRASEEFRKSQLDAQIQDRALNREAMQESRRMTLANSLYTATSGAGSLQAHMAMQDPKIRKQAMDLAALRDSNPQAYEQVVAQDNSLADLADAATGIKELQSQNSAKRRNALINPIKERLLRAQTAWNNQINKKGTDKNRSEGANQSAEAEISDALQDLATVNGRSIQVKVNSKSAESGILGIGKKPAGITVQIQDENGVSQPMSLQEAQSKIVSDKKDPAERFDELHKKNPTWTQAQLEAQMKKEGYP